MAQNNKLKSKAMFYNELQRGIKRGGGGVVTVIGSLRTQRVCQFSVLCGYGSTYSMPGKVPCCHKSVTKQIMFGDGCLNDITLNYNDLTCSHRKKVFPHSWDQHLAYRPRLTLSANGKKQI